MKRIGYFFLLLNLSLGLEVSRAKEPEAPTTLLDLLTQSACQMMLKAGGPHAFFAASMFELPDLELIRMASQIYPEIRWLVEKVEPSPETL